MGNISDHQLLQPAAEQYIAEIAGSLIMQRLRMRSHAGERPTLSDAEVPLFAAYVRGCFSMATAPSQAEMEARVRSRIMRVNGWTITVA